MKFLKFTLFLSILITIFSCKKEENKAAFTFDNDVFFEIPAGLNTIETHVFVVNNIPNTSQVFLSGGFTLEDLSSIQSRIFVLSSRQNDDLSFIRDISIKIYKRTDPGLKYEAAFLDLIPDRKRTQIELFPTLTNLKGIFEDNSYSVEIRLKLRRFSPSFVSSRLRLEFNAFR